MLADTLIESFTEAINRAMWEREEKGLTPIRIEVSPIMRELLHELYPFEPLASVYGLPLRVNPQLQGIALIVRTEEDA